MSPKKIIGLSLILLSMIGTYLFAPWLLIKLWLSPLPDSPQAQIEDILDYKVDGVILYIDQAGKAPKAYAAGWNNRANKVAANPQSLFKVASISKLFIATAATKLIQAKKLDLDAPLSSLLPFCKGHIANADAISLKMLIQHRSGIPNFLNQPDYPWTDLFTENLPALELVYELPADFEPDEKYQYSNTNYLLLGAILDSTLGYSHHQYIKEEILDPLGLKHTYSLLDEVNQDSLMSGYHIGYEPDIKSSNYVHPGGSMISTARDIAVFLRALNEGNFLNPEEQALYESLYRLEHTGSLPGYSSIARYDADLDAVIVLFINTSGGLSWSITEATYRRVLKVLKKE